MRFSLDKRVRRLSFLKCVPKNYEKILALLSEYILDSSVPYSKRRKVIKARMDSADALYKRKNDLSSAMADKLVSDVLASSPDAVLSRSEAKELDGRAQKNLKLVNEIMALHDFRGQQLRIYMLLHQRGKAELITKYGSRR